MRFLHLLLLVPLACGVDLCHDPRTRDLHRSCATRWFALRIPSVQGNPFHALHDTLWAVSHYLRNCARHPLTVYIPTVQNRDGNATALQSLRGANSCDMGGDEPNWGFCVAYILAKAVGASVDTGVEGGGNVGKVCYTQETVLRKRVEGWPESFRGLKWYVDYGDGFGHARLDKAMAGQAFRHIRSVVRRFYGLHKESDGGVVKVLVYDRKDVRRRRWINAKDVVEMLRRMPGVRVGYIGRMPTGLGRQVELFGRCDLVIAPHGGAMANSVFMKDGSGVLEIWKECMAGWVTRRGHEWTNWHAGFVGLDVRYVGCVDVGNSSHRVDGMVVGKTVLEMVKGIRQRRKGISVCVRKRRFLKRVLMIGVLFVAMFALLRLEKVLGRRLERRVKGGGGSV